MHLGLIFATVHKRCKTIPDTSKICRICATRAIEKYIRRLQENELTPLGLNKTAEWCYNLLIVLKLNGGICLCLDPAGLNQAIIKPII